MTVDIVKKIDLDSLRSGIPALSKGKASLLLETCVWCLTECEHDNGTKMKSVNDAEESSFSIHWPASKVDLLAIGRAYNDNDAVEYGAEALSLLLVREQTSYTAIKRAVTGTGIDYWLGKQKQEGDNIFDACDARLEVSGILKENSSNSVKKRIKEKIKQTHPTDQTFPVLISVVEFGQPYAELVLKNVAS